VSAPLYAAGLTMVNDATADVVLVGGGHTVSAAQLQSAAEAIWRGADLLVTSYVPVIAGRTGRIASLSAALGAGLAHVTGTRPTVVGKPSPRVLDAVRARTSGAAEIVVVGDDPALDVAPGRAANAPTVPVLRGVARAADVPSLPQAQRPDVVLDARRRAAVTPRRDRGLAFQRPCASPRRSARRPRRRAA
jgi:4-nitrophenyl phosphatase